MTSRRFVPESLRPKPPKEALLIARASYANLRDRVVPRYTTREAFRYWVCTTACTRFGATPTPDEWVLVAIEAAARFHAAARMQRSRILTLPQEPA